MLATDLRIVAEDARLISGFLRIGLHPGGGHFGLLAGRAGAEAAAAAGIFGEEISGLRAVQLGLAWEALRSERVEERAAELARRAARDPQLARKAAASLRIELGPPRLPWAAALEVGGAPSSGRCAAGSPNSQSCGVCGRSITRVTLSGSIPLNSGCVLRGHAAARQCCAYTPSSR